MEEDLTSPVTPDMSTPVTPTPAPIPTPIQEPTIYNSTPDTVVVKKHSKKPLLLLLLLLVALIVAAWQFDLISIIFPKEETPIVGNRPTATGSMVDTLTTVTGEDTMPITGDDLQIVVDTNTNDMAKINDLKSIGEILLLTKINSPMYPVLKGSYNTNDLFEYVSGFMTELPTDIDGTIWNGFGGTLISGYLYTSLYSGNKPAESFLLMARIDDSANANWIDADPALTQIGNIGKADAVKISQMICTSITVNETTVDSLKNCTAKIGSDKLRYIYIQ